MVGPVTKGADPREDETDGLRGRHRFETTTEIPLPRNEAFAFFADAENLRCTVGTFPEKHSRDYCWGG